MLSHSNKNIWLYTFFNKQTLAYNYNFWGSDSKYMYMQIYLVRFKNHKKVDHSFTTKISLKLGFSKNLFRNY